MENGKEETMLAVNRKTLIYLLLILGIFYALGLNPRLTLGRDDSHFLILAQSLLSGKGYTDIYLPQSKPHTTKPPIFPLLLCPLVWLFGENILILKLVPLFSALASLLVLYLLLKEYTQRSTALILLFLVAINHALFSVSTGLITEATYFLFSLGALYFLIKYTQKESYLNYYLFFSLILMTFSFYTRTSGIAFLFTVFIFFMLKKDFKKALIVSGLFLLLIFPWFYRGWTVGRESHYLEQLLRRDIFVENSGSANLFDFGWRIFMNLIYYAGKVFPETFFNQFTKVWRGQGPFALKIGVGLILSSLTLFGFFRRFRENFSLIEVYVLVNFLICLIWPYHSPRFLFPILPFIFYYFILGIKKFNSRFITLGVLFILFFFSLWGDVAVLAKKSEPYSQEEIRYLEAGEWIKENTDKEAHLMCQKPEVTYLQTGRKATHYPFIADPSQVMREIKENQIDYLIVDAFVSDKIPGVETYLKPVVEKYPEYFTLLHTTPPPENCVYQVNSKGEYIFYGQ